VPPRHFYVKLNAISPAQGSPVKGTPAYWDIAPGVPVSGPAV